MNNFKSGKNRVTFKSFGADLVGNLYLPEGFDYLGTLPFVEEIHGLAVCQGGSIITSAAVPSNGLVEILV